MYSMWTAYPGSRMSYRRKTIISVRLIIWSAVLRSCTPCLPRALHTRRLSQLLVSLLRTCSVHSTEIRTRRLPLATRSLLKGPWTITSALTEAREFSWEVGVFAYQWSNMSLQALAARDGREQHELADGLKGSRQRELAMDPKILWAARFLFCAFQWLVISTFQWLVLYDLIAS